MNKKRKAIFLDRDGTINVEKNYLYRYEDWEWIPGSIEALKLLQNAGYLLIIVTNQAGIARGYYTIEDVHHLHSRVLSELKTYGVEINDIYSCPHHPDITGECDCRKPGSKMLIDAVIKWNIDPEVSFMIGDKNIDCLAAETVGLNTVLVETGYGCIEKKKVKNNVVVCKDVREAAFYILGL